MMICFFLVERNTIHDHFHFTLHRTPQAFLLTNLIVPSDSSSLEEYAKFGIPLDILSEAALKITVSWNTAVSCPVAVTVNVITLVKGLYQNYLTWTRTFCHSDTMKEVKEEEDFFIIVLDLSSIYKIRDIRKKLDGRGCGGRELGSREGSNTILILAWRQALDILRLRRTAEL
ncbi:hypothetical protein K435DRAFT_773765 [Dendrothele bispora CBS 962.96]|uniref:Uncharacterized protein n=1 Tax=Dendrothele bispora (strain CBS 962.96) TaxID=1314807 RepID=A0A4S8MRA0_DENBC|nr:hypothetical protein K435DRAFT_773765 [Dendrothele bispora CBS 962.96]